jgi:hypothetical protein
MIARHESPDYRSPEDRLTETAAGGEAARLHNSAANCSTTRPSNIDSASGIAPGSHSADHRPVEPSGSRSTATRTEIALAGLVVVGIAVLLGRISLLDYGAVIAPTLAGVLVFGLFVARSRVTAGKTRSLLAIVGGGLLVVALLFLAALAVLLIALSNRGV